MKYQLDVIFNKSGNYRRYEDTDIDTCNLFKGTSDADIISILVGLLHENEIGTILAIKDSRKFGRMWKN